MTPTRLSLLVALSLVSACGSSGSLGSGSGSGFSNPFSGGGRQQQEGVVLTPKGGYAVVPPDTRLLVDQVTSLQIVRTLDGKVLVATGLPPTQGYWDGALVSETDMKPEKGVLTLKFRISPPKQATPVSTVPSREVKVALFLSPFKLEGVRQIVVQGERSSRSLRP